MDGVPSTSNLSLLKLAFCHRQRVGPCSPAPPPSFRTIYVVFSLSSESHDSESSVFRLFPFSAFDSNLRYCLFPGGTDATMFGISTSSSLAALLLHTVSAPHAMAMALVPTPVNAHQLLPRESGEHVVLADCKDGTGLLSSQMAYFPGSPGKTPQDVATVQTSPGQAALWINRNTSGLFTTTGVTFTSTIGPKVADGEYAGTGTNGFGPFTCWQEFVKALYVYDGTTCSQVYDCSHERAPGTTSSASPASPW